MSTKTKNKSGKITMELSEWPGFATYKNPPYAYLREQGYKVYGENKPSATSTGKLYWIGTKAIPGGGIQAAVVCFLEPDVKNGTGQQSNEHVMLTKVELKELSAAAAETRSKKLTLFTDYGMEIHSTEKVKAASGFDEIVKVVSPIFKAGGATKAAVKYRCDVAGIGENTWSSNGMEYDSQADAEKALNDLSGRWFGYDLSRIVPSTTPMHEPVNIETDELYQNFRKKYAGGGMTNGAKK